MLFFVENALLLSQKDAQLASAHELCHQFHINIHDSSNWDISGFFLCPSGGCLVGFDLGGDLGVGVFLVF